MNAARFARKAMDLQEVRDSAEDEELTRYAVEATVELNGTQYVAFAQNLCGVAPYDVNRYRGGTTKGVAKVVRIVCRGRATLLCNAEGYDYARYVAIENN